MKKWDSDIELEWDAPKLLEVLDDEYSCEFAMAELCPKDENRNVFSSQYGRSKQNYFKRLKALGFVGQKCILDAGCGMGQWSYVMCEHNEQVVCIDQSEHRLNIAKYLNRKHSNISFTQGNLESMPFNDMLFDAIFCYGVFMFTDMQKTLESFKRHLSKEGIIFLNFNNIGHYVHRMHYHTFDAPHKELFEQYYNMVQNYYKGHYKSSLMTLETIKILLEKLNMCIIYNGYDGQTADLPFYKTEYLGFPYVTEILITHKG